MPTFREVLRAAEITVHDKTSGPRMREIEHILKKCHAFSGLTPKKATDILEELGPTFVKIGQIASDRSDVIPKEYAEAFKELRAHVPPVPFDRVVETIEASYGHPWQEVFASIDETPLGSASIAQVHKARLASPGSAAVGGAPGDASCDGAVVAVKVRRPQVAEQMAEDITLIRHAIALGDLTGVTDNMGFSLHDFVDELERTTAQELDFSVELGNLQRFAQVIEGQEGVQSPKPYPRFSTSEVLVMEYVEGVPVNDVPAVTELGNDPAELGRRLAESYVSQVIDEGFFHADPHPGNIVVRGHDIVWIDLGMTGTLSASERALVGRMLMAVAQKDGFALKDALVALAKPTGPVDHAQLLTKLEAMIASYATADLASLNVGMAFVDVIEVLRTQNLTLPASLTMLARGLLALEGVLAEIAPSASVVGIVSDHLKRQLYSLDAIAGKARDVASAGAASAEAAVHLPTQLSHTLAMLNRGQVKVGADLQVPRDAVAALYSVSGTIALALISAGLFIGSSMLATTSMEPKFLEVPLLGVLGYAGAFVLGVYVIWRALVTRHQQRNNEEVE